MSKQAKLILVSAVSLSIIMCAPFFGAVTISLPEVLNQTDNTASSIFFNLRLPRVLLGFAAGSALAICGMVFQALFQNPLATPYTLGVASGASFGAVLAIQFGDYSSLGGMPIVTVAAFGGSSLVMFIVILIAQLTRALSGATMLLAGVAMSFMFSSLVLFTQYFSDFYQSSRIVRWLMGGLDVFDFGSVAGVALVCIFGVAAVLALLPELDLLSTGDELAASRGVHLKRVKTILFLATSLMVAGVVSVCGPIGFVGIMVPHICRLMFGPSHRILALAVIIVGGSFLVLCDAFSRVIAAPAEMPVGIITSLLGGPFFIFLLFRSLKR